MGFCYHFVPIMSCLLFTDVCVPPWCLISVLVRTLGTADIQTIERNFYWFGQLLSSILWWKEGCYTQKRHSQLWQSPGNLSSVVWPASSCSVQLVFRVSLFPFLWGQFSEPWQHLSRPQSSHHVIDLFHLARVSVSLRQLTGYGSEYYLWPLRRN